jgi:hypothetical protein
MAEPPDLEPYRIALRKRGFRQDDVYLHECPKCGTSRAVEKWVLSGKSGGRDIDLCGACGETWSYRQRPMREQREVDPDFDLATFLKDALTPTVRR